MPARPYWTGQLRLALVSIPVEVFSATKSSSGIAFNQIHEPTGQRIHYEKVADGVGPVSADEIVRGYQYEKNRYVTLTDEEIDSVRLESKKTLELTQFVGSTEIEPIYFERPFWVVPADDLAEEAYRVMRDALRAAKKVGLGQLSLRGRETVVAVKPCGRGLLMESLRYADEVNKAASYFRGISDAASPPELVELAGTLIERRTAPFNADAFHDRYEEALRALIDRKVEGRPVTTAAPEPPAPKSNVVDLMAALKASLEKSPKPAANDAAPPEETPKKRTPARKAAPKAEDKPAPARKRA
jgi:DNA end-binding protein Ku